MGRLSSDPYEVTTHYLASLGWWPKKEQAREDWQKVIAHVCQEFGVRPWEVVQMTPVEIMLYCTDTKPAFVSRAIAFVIEENVNCLTITQRIELARRLYQ